MGDEIVQKLRVEADTDDAKKEVNDLGDSMTESMIKSQLAVQLLNKAFDVFKDLLVEGLESAKEFERTNIKLAAALRGTGHEVENNIDALNRQSSELEVSTGISDEVLRSAQALAINLGVSADKTEEYTKAAIRMSNTIGGDVRSSMERLIKLNTGVIDRNLKLIPGIEELTKEQLASGDAIALVNEAWGENLGILQEGYTGEVNRLTNEFANLGEELGKFITQNKEIQGTIHDVAIQIGGLAQTVTTLRRALTGDVSLGDLAGAAFEDVKTALGIGETELGAKSALDTLLDEAEKITDRAPTGKREEDSRDRDKGRRKRKKKKRSREDPAADFLEAEIRDRERALETQARFAEEDQRLQTEAADREREVLDLRAERQIEFEEMKTQLLMDQRGQRNEILEQETADLQKATDERVRLAEKESKKRSEFMRQAADTIGGIAGGLATTMLEGFVAIAEGSAVSFDQLAKSFLKSTGMQLIGQGILSAFTGAARLLLSYGADQSGTALIAEGGLMVAAGVPMLAGSLAIQSPQGAAATKPEIAGAIGDINAVGGGGGTPGITPTPSFGGQGGGSTVANVFVVGELTEQQAITIRRGLETQSAKGF
jgi:hypothetical protein